MPEPTSSPASDPGTDAAPVSEREPDHVVLLLGGARSGKSDFAVRHATQRGGDVVFVATATAGDADMAERIRRHRADRPAGWGLLEESHELVDAVAGADSNATLVVDCITLWVSNLVLDDVPEAGVLSQVDALADVLAGRPGASVVVSNEVGLGVHPPSELGMVYRDVLGRANQALARRADRSLFFVAGRAMELTDPDELLAP